MIKYKVRIFRHKQDTYEVIEIKTIQGTFSSEEDKTECRSVYQGNVKKELLQK